MDSSTADAVNQTYEPIVDPWVQVGSVLTITVSALDMEAVAPYNLPVQSYLTPGGQTLSTTNSLQTYLVDEEGQIDFPLLGKVDVAGLRRTEVKSRLEELLSTQLKSPLVTVNVINQYVTILGEVAHPGRYSIVNGRLTIPELLAYAGDMTPYGKRNNVLLTREKDGKLEFIRLNMNDEEIFSSPYFFLMPNDVLYISPNSVRAINSQNVSLWLSMVSTVASAATVIVTVINAAKKD
ncbi:MAG: polysaccharide biosynthesis/export family protein [Paludibacteraceae bacterium]|nr:polysaccharide biosynthesis/export family protein [Paludibacteraceae bacterium]